mmetsp:Transcript_2958/g.6284  ORF Transcript_2958/g.6284 Transcript_2958/m.6284 type:complete len:129 (-) Transcript_2958:62-448(-)
MGHFMKKASDNVPQDQPGMIFPVETGPCFMVTFQSHVVVVVVVVVVVAALLQHKFSLVVTFCPINYFMESFFECVLLWLNENEIQPPSRMELVPRASHKQQPHSSMTEQIRVLVIGLDSALVSTRLLC